MWVWKGYPWTDILIKRQPLDLQHPRMSVHMRVHLIPLHHASATRLHEADSGWVGYKHHIKRCQSVGNLPLLVVPAHTFSSSQIFFEENSDFRWSKRGFERVVLQSLLQLSNDNSTIWYLAKQIKNKQKSTNCNGFLPHSSWMIPTWKVFWFSRT